ncbi:polysaccharide biosynthesis/export family protein [Sphingomonas corticis]|jgi:polysaccharide export outer membrane protein|uniref:Polysaccharide transporter n=1 Tax=Sphingomonas corticis TaxID=2722791 RepID=A0ABX1CMA5_9SPHN|nr:polysaccharide biosynthesis/export family protein [Sphingomonas corticis]NJR77966.1 polysaccharide transporter [Sphingomonas corticis]
MARPIRAAVTWGSDRATSRFEGADFSMVRCRTACRTAAAVAALLLAPAVLPAAAAPRAPEYRINAGDELEIFVWGEERMQRPVRVLPDGTFAFPLAGVVEAEGRSSRELAELLRQRLKGKYRDTVPDVTVAVRDPAGMRFYVVGKVRAPGSYPIGRTVNVVQALSVAGGPAEFADVGNAVIMRQTAAGQTVERINLSDVLKGARSLKAGPQGDALPMLGAGDVLVVP